MAKQITSYEQDIRDSLSATAQVKHAVKIASQMKLLQKNALASEDFKTSLKTRLADIYSIDNVVERVPRLHILRNFMMFCSFFFISGVIFIVLDSRDNIQEEIHQRITEEDISHTEILSNSENKEYIEQVQPSSLEKTSEERNANDYSEVEAKQDSDESKTQQSDEEITSDDIIPESSAIPASSMMRESSEVFEDDMIDADVGDAGMRPEDEYEDSQAIYEFYRMEFYEICEANSGTVQDDEYSCKFEEGEICTMDNIRKNSENPCEYLYGINRDEK